MNKTKLFLKRHSSTILTFVSAAGVVTTTVLAVNATPKAIQLIEEKKKEKGSDLTPIETAKAAWKPYIPTVISGVSTIACIFGINFLNAKSQASLMSAYAVLDNSYREYREKTIEMHGEDSDYRIKRKIVSSNFDKNMVLDKDKELFFDFQSMQYFESTFDEIKEAENTINELFAEHDVVYLNDLYDILGVPMVDYGYQMGWYMTSDSKLEFDYEKVKMDDGLECWILLMSTPPELDYIY